MIDRMNTAFTLYIYFFTIRTKSVYNYRYRNETSSIIQAIKPKEKIDPKRSPCKSAITFKRLIRNRNSKKCD